MMHNHFDQPHILEYDKIKKLPHIGTPGTWWGLPDFQITEGLAAAGLIPSNKTTVNPKVINPTGAPAGQAATFPTATSSTGGGGGSWGTGDVAGATTNLSGTGGTPNPNPNPNPAPNNYLSGAEDTAAAQARAELESALNEYGRQEELLTQQSGQLDLQRGTAMSEIETQRGRAEKEHTTAEEEATAGTEAAKSKALATAGDVVKRNRNVLRALGILSSSAAGEMLTKPMTEYGTQRGELEQGLLKRLQTVEDWWMQRGKDFDTAKQGIESQYADLKNKIAIDLRFNKAQQATAIRQATAALSARLGEIEQQRAAFAQAAQQYSNNVLLQIAQLKMYQNPSADLSAIMSTLMPQVNSGYQGPTASIVQSEQQKKKAQENASLLSGLSSGLGT